MPVYEVTYKFVDYGTVYIKAESADKAEQYVANGGNFDLTAYLSSWNEVEVSDTCDVGDDWPRHYIDISDEDE